MYLHITLQLSCLLPTPLYPPLRYLREVSVVRHVLALPLLVVLRLLPAVVELDHLLGALGACVITKDKSLLVWNLFGWY